MKARVNADNNEARAAVRAFLDAASTGDVTAVGAYLHSGGDVNASLGEGWTALHCAVTRSHVRVLERLFREDACDRNALTVVGTSALAMALRLRNNVTTRELLDRGASRATVAQDELRRVWDADWLWPDVRRRLHPSWSIMWTPATHHSFSRQERDKCRLVLLINHTMATFKDAHDCDANGRSRDGAKVTFTRLLTTLWIPLLEERVIEPKRRCSWTYLPPAVVQLVLQYALFLW